VWDNPPMGVFKPNTPTAPPPPPPPPPPKTPTHTPRDQDMFLQKKSCFSGFHIILRMTLVLFMMI
jgi:hypothetical protein